MKRTNRAELARQTLSIVERGHYQAPSGRRVSIVAEQAEAVSGTTLHTPDDLDDILAHVLATEAQGRASIEVVEETTLEAIFRLSEGDTQASVMALNFASARNPGGGFLKGSQAQEESLARASGLYPCLLTQPRYYQHHRTTRSGFYSDHMIHSPRVPVIRDDEGSLVESPALVSFITSPAVNAGTVRQRDKRKARLIPGVMAQRTARMLALAAHHGHDTLVLGAWGCGVFRNEPETIAEVFREALVGSMSFISRFERVIFAVPCFSKKDKNHSIFERALGGL